MKKSSRGEEGIQRVRGLKPWRWRFFRSAILPTRRIFTAHSRSGQRLQTEVIALCLTLEQLIDALKASKAYPGINQHKADIWIQHSLDVRYLCAAWRDRELERHLL